MYFTKWNGTRSEYIRLLDYLKEIDIDMYCILESVTIPVVPVIFCSDSVPILF